MVDHRADWTYTLVLPHAEKLANERGAESYRRIHAALADALTAEGVSVRLSAGAEETGAALCFGNPVNHDLVGPNGRKLAGAGQRRTRQGLLHQGSAADACDGENSRLRAERLAARLADSWAIAVFQPDPMLLVSKTVARYANPSWLARR